MDKLTNKEVLGIMNGNLITEPRLIHRGWTEELIQKYLPQPMLFQNNDSTVKCWERAVVENGEHEFCLDVERFMPGGSL